MSARSKVWLVGLAASAPLVGWLARSPGSRELIAPVGLLALAGIAMAAEAVAAFRPVVGTVRKSPEGARPADGRVEILPMGGVEATPLREDPRWRRFDRLDPAGPGPRRVGSIAVATPPLLGQVALISLFIGRDGRPWTPAEIARGHRSLERAGLWIEAQAARLGVPVNVGLADTYFEVEDDADDPVEVGFAPEAVTFGPAEVDESSKAIAGASRAAGRFGFADVVDLLGRINPRVEADARVWLVHVRRAGRSIAILAEDSDLPGVGLALCYSREASFPEPLAGPGRVDPTSVVHELLHLFGASDKYGVPLGSFAGGQVTRRDVMRLDFESLSKLTIDPMTASEVGWGHGPGPGPPRKNRP